MALIETERLKLVPFTVNDASFIFELLNSPLWKRFIGDRGINTLEDAHQYLINVPLKQYETLGYGLYAVYLKEESIPIGMCGLLKRDFLEHPDIGFAFLAQYMGKGYAFEAASATLDYARKELKMETIAAIVNQDNEASIKLLEKLGFHFDKLMEYPGESVQLRLYIA